MTKEESEEQGGNNFQGLIQQFKNLEQEWKSFEKSRPIIKNPPTHSEAGSHSSSSNTRSIINSFEQLLSNSPRELMSSLQHKDIIRSTCGDGIPRAKSCDSAVEEILGERRAAITSGDSRRWRRRLFAAEEGRSGEVMDLNYGGEVCSDCSSNSTTTTTTTRGREGVVDGNFSGGENSSSDSSLTEEKAVVVVETRGGDRKMRGGGRCVAVMAWFGFVLIIVTVGLISITCNGKYVQENEFFLVPT
ncbi:hypothetical protein ABFS83_09G065100 [Erythranthe nasuta]